MGRCQRIVCVLLVNSFGYVFVCSVVPGIQKHFKIILNQMTQRSSSSGTSVPLTQLSANNVQSMQQIAVSQLNASTGTPDQSSMPQITTQVQTIPQGNILSQNPPMMSNSDVSEVQLSDMSGNNGQTMQMAMQQINNLNPQVISGSNVSDVQMNQLSTSSGQTVQMPMTQLNSSAGASVQTSNPQITVQAQTVPAGNMMSQSSGHHPIMIHPMMTMAQPPLQQLQNSSASVQMAVQQRNANTGNPVQITQLNTSTGQPVQMAVSQLNSSASTPVQTSVAQLTAQAQTMSNGNLMSQSSGTHHTMIHPTMTMAQTPLQQVQVIQQPLSTSYLQQIYPQQQMLFPGNVTLQHSGMTASSLQSIGSAQGLSLQLQAKAIDSKSSGTANLQTINTNKQAMAVNTGTMLSAQAQVLQAVPKGNFQQHVIASPSGKSTIIHGQTGFAPANSNQTVLMSHMGMLPNQQTVFSLKTLQDSQKGKTFTFQNQPATLQPKSMYSSPVPVQSHTQMFNGGQLKQIAAQPQIITSQASGNVLNQTQLFGLQTLNASLPPGLTWATPSGLQSSNLLGQNPIIFRSSQESNMLIQSQPQATMHLPVAAATQPVPPTPYATAAMPQKHKQVKVRQGTQTVAVATQTIVSSASVVNSNLPIKPKVSKLINSTAPVQIAPQMATSQTQTNQLIPPSVPQAVQQPASQVIMIQPKSDASNQTQSAHANDKKGVATFSKSVSVGVDTKPQSQSVPKSQAMVSPSTKIVNTCVSSCVDMTVSLSTSTISTLSSSIPVMTTSTTQVNTPVPSVEIISSNTPSISQVPPMPQKENSNIDVQTSSAVSPELFIPHQTETKEIAMETDHLKPQQPIAKPSLGPVKDKQPQKAIVKPQVLTHVIDGFLIQEGPEPFPVRSALLDSPCRNVTSEKYDSNLKRKDSSSAVSPEKKVKVHRGRGNVELANCEICGKLGEKNKFKKSKRFCSTSCAKNAKKSNGSGPKLHPENQANVTTGPGRKKKVGRGRKGVRKQIQAENKAMDSSVIEENNIVVSEESSTFPNKLEEEISPPLEDVPSLPPPNSEKMNTETLNSEPSCFVPPNKKLPTKWSVQEVFEFIRDMPGCSDYADVFQSQEIDGQALILLKEDHLMSSMSMKLGPALKLLSQINTIKEEFGLS